MSNNNTNDTSLVAFSLSPHMNMEQAQPQPQPQPSPQQTSFFLSPHFYGEVEGHSEASFYSNQLSCMPLKSDGSLCIIQQGKIFELLLAWKHDVDDSVYKILKGWRHRSPQSWRIS